ncbi:putative Myotubularin [Monocercomonoides exilis]|uniref:putative Myotubularin n=1 Tax=Monocercomonoides exilis TaxID=2049356 RepID=UPI003559DEEC|nr:putative Myotubularin [Monocercomonoides exilis]
MSTYTPKLLPGEFVKPGHTFPDISFNDPHLIGTLRVTNYRLLFHIDPVKVHIEPIWRENQVVYRPHIPKLSVSLMHILSLEKIGSLTSQSNRKNYYLKLFLKDGRTIHLATSPCKGIRGELANAIRLSVFPKTPNKQPLLFAYTYYSALHSEFQSTVDESYEFMSFNEADAEHPGLKTQPSSTAEQIAIATRENIVTEKTSPTNQSKSEEENELMQYLQPELAGLLGLTGATCVTEDTTSSQESSLAPQSQLHASDASAQNSAKNGEDEHSKFEDHPPAISPEKYVQWSHCDMLSEYLRMGVPAPDGGEKRKARKNTKHKRHSAKDASQRLNSFNIQESPSAKSGSSVSSAASLPSAAASVPLSSSAPLCSSPLGSISLSSSANPVSPPHSTSPFSPPPSFALPQFFSYNGPSSSSTQLTPPSPLQPSMFSLPASMHPANTSSSAAQQTATVTAAAAAAATTTTTTTTSSSSSLLMHETSSVAETKPSSVSISTPVMFASPLIASSTSTKKSNRKPTASSPGMALFNKFFDVSAASPNRIYLPPESDNEGDDAAADDNNTEKDKANRSQLSLSDNSANASNASCASLNSLSSNKSLSSSSSSIRRISTRRVSVPLHRSWRLTMANILYKLCSSYPRLLAVPAAVSDVLLLQSSTFRARERVCVLSYLHSNGAALCRSAQPKTGISIAAKRNCADEKVIEAISLCTKNTKTAVGEGNKKLNQKGRSETKRGKRKVKRKEINDKKSNVLNGKQDISMNTTNLGECVNSAIGASIEERSVRGEEGKENNDDRSCHSFVANNSHFTSEEHEESDGDRFDGSEEEEEEEEDDDDDEFDESSSNNEFTDEDIESVSMSDVSDICDVCTLNKSTLDALEEAENEHIDISFRKVSKKDGLLVDSVHIPSKLPCEDSKVEGDSINLSTTMQENNTKEDKKDEHNEDDESASRLLRNAISTMLPSSPYQTVDLPLQKEEAVEQNVTSKEVAREEGKEENNGDDESDEWDISEWVEESEEESLQEKPSRSMTPAIVGENAKSTTDQTDPHNAAESNNSSQDVNGSEKTEQKGDANSTMSADESHLIVVGDDEEESEEEPIGISDSDSDTDEELGVVVDIAEDEDNTDRNSGSCASSGSNGDDDAMSLMDDVLDTEEDSKFVEESIKCDIAAALETSLPQRKESVCAVQQNTHTPTAEKAENLPDVVKQLNGMQINEKGKRAENAEEYDDSVEMVGVDMLAPELMSVLGLSMDDISQGNVASFSSSSPSSSSAAVSSSSPLATSTTQEKDNSSFYHTGSTTSRADAPLLVSPLHIVDARPYLAAFGNSLMKGGFEDQKRLPWASFEFLGIPNIHTMRLSQKKLAHACRMAVDAVSESKKRIRWEAFEASVLATRWPEYISLLLSSAKSLSVRMTCHGQHILIHCSDGWDRTPALCSLTAMMLCPFYRTIDGFVVLVEKDWAAFGHRFALRTGMKYSQKGTLDEKNISPTFMQFLDCVYQLLQQFPEAFEFNEMFLLSIAKHLFTARFGTFLCDSEAEREEKRIPLLTESLWSYLKKKDKRQKLLSKSYRLSEEPLRPQTHKIHLWPIYFPHHIKLNEPHFVQAQPHPTSKSPLVLPHHTNTSTRQPFHQPAPNTPPEHPSINYNALQNASNSAGFTNSISPSSPFNGSSTTSASSTVPAPHADSPSVPSTSASSTYPVSIVFPINFTYHCRFQKVAWNTS